MAASRDHKQTIFVLALGRGCSVADAAREAEVNEKTAHAWISASPQLREAIEIARETHLDAIIQAAGLALGERIRETVRAIEMTDARGLGDVSRAHQAVVGQQQAAAQRAAARRALDLRERELEGKMRLNALREQIMALQAKGGATADELLAALGQVDDVMGVITSPHLIPRPVINARRAERIVSDLIADTGAGDG